MIVDISRHGHVRLLEVAAAREGGLEQRQTGESNHVEAGALECRRVIEALDIGPRLKLVTSPTVKRRWKEIDEKLLAPAVFARVDEVIPAAAFGIENIGLVALRNPAMEDALPGESGFEQRS